MTNERARRIAIHSGDIATLHAAVHSDRSIMTQYHEKAWKQFAHEQHLNLKRVPGLSFVEYEYASTRTAKAAWDRRSEIEASSEGANAYYNSAIQHASEVAYLHGEEVAKVIQGMRR